VSSVSLLVTQPADGAIPGSESPVVVTATDQAGNEAQCTIEVVTPAGETGFSCASAPSLLAPLGLLALRRRRTRSEPPN
jgi:hypothetical protein